jgi:ribonuclease HI
MYSSQQQNNSENIINCLQINLQRSKHSTAHLAKYIEEKQIDIIFIQEPYVIKGKVCGFPLKFRLFYCENCDRPKSAIAIANDSIQAIAINTFTNTFSTIINVKFKLKVISLISIYCSPFECLATELSHIKTAINSLKPQNLIISADSNANSRVWFSKSDDSRGDLFNDFIAENNLLLLNNNENIATYHTTRGESFIDLTLTNVNCVSLIKNWEVLEIDSLSDHRFISFTIAGNCEEINYKSTKKYNTKLANWADFERKLFPIINDLENSVESIESSVELNCLIENFNEKLTKVCNKTIPKCLSTKNVNINKWWTRELTIARLDTNRARRRYQRCQTSARHQLQQNYLEVRAQYITKIKEQKIKSLNKFIEENTRDNPFGLIYKLSQNKIKFEKVNELLSDDGRLITSSEEIAQTLIDSLFPIDRPEEDDDFHKEIRAKSLTDFSQTDDMPLTLQEVTNVVNAQNEKKAPGEDGFSADIVKRVHSISSSFLLKIYNKCLAIGHFPNCWKSCVIKVIRKAGKTDYRKVNAYRPISLISVFGKIFEKLLINRIVHYLNENKMIDRKQYGFSPQKSTDDAMHTLKDFVNNAYQKHGFALSIFIDIDGAFNNTWWAKIINDLREKRCPKNLFLTTKSYFENRSAKLWFCNSEVKRNLTIGCPQGSASGPWFWNISYNDVFDIEMKESDQIIGFADDTRLDFFAQTIEDLERQANQALAKLCIWAKNSKICFNSSKTVCVLFTKNIKYNSPKIFLNNKQLEISKNVKYLGVYFDSKLSWKPHANYIKAKATQTTMNLLSFAEQKFGLNINALETIYKGAILPLISYGCSVWWEGINREYVKKPFTTLQRQIAIRFSRAYKTVSTEALNVLANLIPIDLYLKQRAINYFIKKGVNNSLTESYLEETNIDLRQIQKPFPNEKLPHFALRKSIVEVSDTSTEYVVYTDGSKSNARVGAAFYVFRGDLIVRKAKYKLANHCSVFQSELFAILKAITYVNKTFNNYLSITICIDSLSVIRALEDCNSDTHLIQLIYNEIRIAETNNIKIYFNWVRAHAGNYGNELADTLAKEGAITSKLRLRSNAGLLCQKSCLRKDN